MRYRIRILLVACLILAAWVIGQRVTDKPVQTIGYKLPKFEEVTFISVERTGQPRTELFRKDGTWTVNGSEAPIDPHALKKIAEAMANSVKMDMEIGRPPSLSEYGLSEHAITLSFQGASRQRIRIGKVVNDRTTFIRDEESGLVYRAQTNLRGAFDRPAQSWRKRQVFDVRFEEVRSLQSERMDQVIWQVSRADHTSPWRFEIPRGMAAGQKEIGAVANTLVTASAQEFSEAKNLAVERVRLSFTTAKQRFGLALGKRTPNGGVQAQALQWSGSKLLPTGPVFVLPRHQAIFLEPSASDLRNRRLFRFSSDQVEGVRVLQPHPLELRRKGVQWTLMSGSETKSLRRELGDLYTERLSTLRAVSVPSKIPKDAFKTPFGTATIKLEDGRLVRARIGNGFGSGRYVQIDDDPTRVMIVSKSGIGVLLPTLSDFKQGPQPPAGQK